MSDLQKRITLLKGTLSVHMCWLSQSFTPCAVSTATKGAVKLVQVWHTAKPCGESLPGHCQQAGC